jgi:hypothetical protein
MKKQTILLGCLSCVLTAVNSRAMDLKQSKITQVVNDVEIVSAANQTEKTATVNTLFTMPDILRTGTASRAELIAPDETITRVGANTIFSFDPANRTIDLKQGSLLFHSPHGKGGGTIHTGSATASVLGTTLIVTTTPNGGFKVIDLEGHVEVSFLNHLKQKLAPGEMTFILPGGKTLAPIVVFRLDELTKNSLLVKGFNQPLSSMSLIINEMEKQLTLIKSGKATDTTWIVGEDANQQQVQVIDPNTVQALQAARNSDAIINQPSLTDPSVSKTPDHIFTDIHFTLPNNPFFGKQNFIGFTADNISINTLALRNLTVDMSPYANLPEFDLVAAANLNVDGSVSFSGFSPQTSLYFSLIGGKQVNFAPDITVDAEVANFLVTSAGTIKLNADTILNNVGNISLTSGSDFSIANNSDLHAYGSLVFNVHGNLSVANSSLSGENIFLGPATGTLKVTSSQLTLNRYGILSATKSITLSDSTISADPGFGAVAVNSKSGSVTLTGTSIRSQYLSVNSGDGILLDGTGAQFTSSGNGSSANFIAANTISMNNADLTSYAAINMVANTITLVSTAFGGNSIDNFGTKTGDVYVNNNKNVMGALNLHNVTYGGTAITSAGQVHQTGGPGTTPGMYSYAYQN